MCRTVPPKAPELAESQHPPLQDRLPPAHSNPCHIPDSHAQPTLRKHDDDDGHDWQEQRITIWGAPPPPPHTGTHAHSPRTSLMQQSRCGQVAAPMRATEIPGSIWSPGQQPSCPLEHRPHVQAREGLRGTQRHGLAAVHMHARAALRAHCCSAANCLISRPPADRQWQCSRPQQSILHETAMGPANHPSPASQRHTHTSICQHIHTHPRQLAAQKPSQLVGTGRRTLHACCPLRVCQQLPAQAGTALN